MYIKIHLNKSHKTFPLNCKLTWTFTSSTYSGLCFDKNMALHVSTGLCVSSSCFSHRFISAIKQKITYL